MKRIFFIILVLCILFSGCAMNTTLTDSKGKLSEVKSYGLLTKDRKLDNVVYEISARNIICAVVFVETLFVPILVVTHYLYVPVLIID